MKRLFVTVFTLVLLLTHLMAVAASFSWFADCREVESDRVTLWIGYSSSVNMPDSTFSYEGGGPGIWFTNFTAGTHHKVIQMIFLKDVDHKEHLSVWVDPEHYGATFDIKSPAPDCSAGTGQPDGGLKTVTKEVAPGSYTWEIRDAYGHWSYVATTDSQQEGNRVFVRLVLGPDNANTNADDYRVTATG